MADFNILRKLISIIIKVHSYLSYSVSLLERVYCTIGIEDKDFEEFNDMIDEEVELDEEMLRKSGDYYGE